MNPQKQPPPVALTTSGEEIESASLSAKGSNEDSTTLAAVGSPARTELALRPYQEDAIRQLRAALAGGSLRVLLYAPTGSGKTEIALAMVVGARAKGRRVIFLANRIHLVEQTSRRFYASGIDHGILQGDNTRDVHQPVLIGSIDTVARRGFPDCDLIIIDEAHAVAGSKSFREVIFRNSARPIIGLSATPFSRGLGGCFPDLGNEPLFERLIVASTIAELIDAGYLVDADIFAPGEPDLSDVKATRNAFGESDFNEVQLAAAVDKPKLVADIVATWFRLANGLPTVVFATNIAHSKHIVEQFRSAGVSAEHLDCYTSDDDRREILARIESGTTTVVSNVGILAEGWDFPACRCLVLARPTRSLCRFIQMAGRVLRTAPGKDRALLLDHSGTVKRLGFPTDDLPLQLDDGKPRANTRMRERQDPLPTVCPSCSYLRAPKVHVCPKCGFAPQRRDDVKVADGILVKIRRGKARVARDERQHVFSQLLFIARKRRYSPGWVAHQYRELFDVWPRGMRGATAKPTPELMNWLTSKAISFAKSRENQHGD